MRTVARIFLLVFLSTLTLFPILAQGDVVLPEHTACPEGVDLTGQTIRLYHVLDQSEQIETLVDPLQAGYADASAYFNANGGICGATVESVFSDSQPQNIIAQYADFAAREPRPVMVALYSSPSAEDLYDQLAEDEIPALLVRGGTAAALYGEDSQTPGWIFGSNPLYVNQIGLMCDYIATHPRDFPSPVLGFLSWDEPWSRAAVTEEVIAYCEALGIGYAGAGYFPDNARNIQVYVQDRVDAGANILFTLSLVNSPTLIAQTLADMGLSSQVKLAGANIIMDPSVASFGSDILQSEGVPALNGTIGLLTTRTFTEQDHLGIQFIAEQAALNDRPPQTRNKAYINAWTATDLFIETYIQTGARVGFDAVTGADIKDTLETIVYEPLGGVQHFDYQGGTRRDLPDDRIGMIRYLGRDGVNPASIENPILLTTVGDKQVASPMLIPLTDFMPSPDLRPGAMIAADTVPTSVPVASTGSLVFEGRYDGFGENDTEIYMMPAEGGEPIPLTDTDSFSGQPIWSPDGTRVAFVSTRDGNMDIYAMNADGSDPVNLSNTPAFEELPSWSPDGTKIVFTSERDGNPELYLMNADGTDPVRLTDNETLDLFPTISPDGMRIAFTSDRDGNLEIYTMALDGSDLTRLTEDEGFDDLFPIWSPDGTQILFKTYRDSYSDIYVMNADGSDPINVTDNPYEEEKPAWSPDSSQIVFASDLDGSWELYTITLDGGDPVRLTEDDALKGWVSWEP